MEKHSFKIFNSRLFRCSSFSRNKNIEEIMNTEKSFRNHLKLLITHFRSPLKALNLISKEDLAIIFHNIMDILEFSEKMIEDMNKYSIIEAFKQNLNNIHVFTSYANNYAGAIKKIEYLKNDYEFSNFIEHQETISCLSGLKFQSLLITPIQRVPRYRLLLQNLLYNTKITSSNYNTLISIVKQISEYIENLNDCLKMHETYTKMTELQKKYFSKYSINLFSPGRILVKEDKLLHINSNGTSIDVKCFLFNDCIIIMKNPRKKPELYLLEDVIVERVFNGLKTKSSTSTDIDISTNSLIELNTTNCLEFFKKFKIPKNGIVFRIVTKKKDYLFLSTSKSVGIEWMNIIMSLQKKKQLENSDSKHLTYYITNQK